MRSGGGDSGMGVALESGSGGGHSGSFECQPSAEMERMRRRRKRQRRHQQLFDNDHAGGGVMDGHDERSLDGTLANPQRGVTQPSPRAPNHVCDYDGCGQAFSQRGNLASM